MKLSYNLATKVGECCEIKSKIALCRRQKGSFLLSSEEISALNSVFHVRHQTQHRKILAIFFCSISDSDSLLHAHQTKNASVRRNKDKSVTEMFSHRDPGLRPFLDRQAMTSRGREKVIPSPSFRRAPETSSSTCQGSSLRQSSDRSTTCQSGPGSGLFNFGCLPQCRCLPVPVYRFDWRQIDLSLEQERAQAQAREPGVNAGPALHKPKPDEARA